ncbi:MAG: RloB domain-containing protein [Boseongicola sp. SB0662_bin_57]|nr:RloB domain-containing protein [Boseongicola sp. SB0662_bin_57]
MIVTEGSKTEPEYFRLLIQELGLTTAKVKITGDGGSAPISVVEFAEGLLKDDPDFEHVFLVFDRDRHTTYDAAIAKAESLRCRNAPRKQAVKAIPSIPSFEIWYRFHVSGERRPYATGEGGGSPAQELIRDLKVSHACFASYAKTNCDAFYDEIRPMRDQACTRADKALEEASKEGQPPFRENPSTRVHLVVRRLQDMARRQEAES